MLDRKFKIGDVVVACMYMDKLTQGNSYTVVDHSQKWFEFGDEILDMHVSVIDDDGVSSMYLIGTFKLLSEIRNNRLSELLK